MKNGLIIVLIVTSIFICQNVYASNEKFRDYQLSSKKYFTDSNGTIMMKVNVWGHVNSPGGHMVYDGIDFASLLSIVGGPLNGADLKKVRLYREVPDHSGHLTYKINLDDFIRSGDRTEFIKINPNDTIIVPQKFTNVIMRQIGTVNTFLSLAMLYMQLQILMDR
tara:strand:+ start:5220 stop:5714 length:495 start_codon:yes stop_codon:yes gene_type:complete